MPKKTFTLAELATMTQSQLAGDPDYRISNVADLESASAEDVSFLANPRYEQAMLKSQAGAIFAAPQSATAKGRNFLINENPSRAFQVAVEAYYNPDLDASGFHGIHPTAVIHPTAKLGNDVNIGPHAVIDQYAAIGNRTTIFAGCYIGPGVTIGEDCLIYSHVTIRERCTLGHRVVIQPGAVIGSCGFGFTTDKMGRHTKLNQVGSVIIEDDVEIGANTTIDRARFKTTRIGRGTKIDNLVQIGHGVQVGQDVIIVAQTGIAGSTEIGNHVMIGGQVAINGHIKVADNAMISARAGVSKTLTEAGKYGGVPAVPLHEYNRNSVHLKNIETHIKEIKELKARVDELETKN